MLIIKIWVTTSDPGGPQEAIVERNLNSELGDVRYIPTLPPNICLTLGN